MHNKMAFIVHIGMNMHNKMPFIVYIKDNVSLRPLATETHTKGGCLL